MKKIFIIAIFMLALVKGPAFANSSLPQAPKQDFFRGRVVEVVEQGEKTIEGYRNYYQTLRVQIIDGTQKGKFTIIENGKDIQITKDQLVSKNQQIIVTRTIYPTGQTVYSIYDYYRLNSLILFVIIFFIAVFLIAGKKGLGSILGMLTSLGIILLYIIPNILKGNDPLTVTLIGSIFILLITTYLAHGVSKKTTIALISTLISLFLTAAFAIIAVKFNNITGLGNEDSFALSLGPTNIIDIRGLFLSGVIISTLGALNDITTTQSATILELKKANPKLKFMHLFEKGLSVGKEHIASLVNTLVLAYVGSAFAVFIFLVLNPAHLPYWVILNNEIVSDEVIKIIAGSIGLLLSVPIVTILASYVFSKIKA
jgi:uncharacterized membrane protein